MIVMIGKMLIPVPGNSITEHDKSWLLEISVLDPKSLGGGGGLVWVGLFACASFFRCCSLLMICGLHNLISHFCIRSGYTGNIQLSCCPPPLGNGDPWDSPPFRFRPDIFSGMIDCCWMVLSVGSLASCLFLPLFYQIINTLSSVFFIFLPVFFRFFCFFRVAAWLFQLFAACFQIIHDGAAVPAYN